MNDRLLQIYERRHRLIPIIYPDGDVRRVTPLAARVIENEAARSRRPKSKLRARSFARTQATRCKYGHPMTGPKANVRQYRYGGYIHRTCYVCALNRGKNRPKKAPKAVGAAKARKAAA